MDTRALTRRRFAAIAESYDLANTLLSLGLDLWWRREAIKALHLSGKDLVLDCCAGTMRLGRGILSRWPGAQVIALDFSLVMLGRGIKRAHNTPIRPVGGDAERLPFRDETFDQAIVGFGIRNLAHPLQGIAELFRVTKRGERVVILEFGRPSFPVFKQVYRWYLARFIPWAGSLVSGHKEVYHYLHSSIMAFPEPAQMMAMMQKAGFSNIGYQKLTAGIVNLYSGEKA